MRTPPRLEPLLDVGAIDEVLRPLMSGKEADVFLVRTGEERRVAKVYKEAEQRSFKHRADYVEGRRTKSSRTERAMSKKSKFGKEQIESAWRTAEVDVIYRLREAEVRVPEPFDFIEGVLVMELIIGADGEPAPRLCDVDLSQREAEAVFDRVLRDIVRMLLAGVVHGDLSDFNILMGPDGPVIIDFPQATDPAFNRNAQKLFVRDVDNVTNFLGRFSPRLRERQYGLEIWDKYERNQLDVDTPLTGKAPRRKKAADPTSLLDEIAELEREAQKRREAAGIVPKKKFQKPVVVAPLPQPLPPQREGGGKKRRRKRGRKREDGPPGPPAQAARDGRPPDRAPAPSAEPTLDLDDLDDLLTVDGD